MAREFGRHLRVGSELTRVLNSLLQSEVKDPRLVGVRVSEVDLSGDLGVARVYFSTLDPDADPKPVEQAFASAAAFIRSRVGRELKLRRVPELRFARDTSAQRGQRIARLIAGAGSDADPDSTAED